MSPASGRNSLYHTFSIGLRYFYLFSSIDQSNFIKIVEVANDFSSLNKFRKFHLTLCPLVNFSLCKCFKYFGRVRVAIDGIESVDNFNLFLKYCKYCYSARLFNCKFVDSLEFKGLDEVLHRRIEELELVGCTYEQQMPIWQDIEDL